MARVDDILAKVRSSLADPSSSRWSDERLYSLISEAQDELALRASLIRKKTTIAVLENSSTQYYPADLITMTRVVDSDKNLLPLVTYDQLDEKDLYWEVATGTEVEGIAYNNCSSIDYRVYPILVNTGNIVYFVFSSVYGIVVNGDGLGLSSIYGVIAGALIDDSIYGVDVALSYAGVEITIQYIAHPPGIAADSTTLLIPEDYDIAIERFVKGLALLDNIDSQNTEMGIEELKLYEAELVSAARDSASNFTKPIAREVKMLWAE